MRTSGKIDGQGDLVEVETVEDKPGSTGPFSTYNDNRAPKKCDIAFLHGYD